MGKVKIIIDDSEFLGVIKTFPKIVERGGKGSGNHGHAGRPGEVGGSSSDGGSVGEADMVWSGEKVEVAGKKISKIATGEIGEFLAAKMLEDRFDVPFSTMNNGKNNAPIDLAGDHMAVEVKTGLASNGKSAQQWRATLGEFGPKEKKLVSKMTAEEKREYLLFRASAILERKQIALDKMSEMADAPINPFTVGIILHPDGSRGDVYLIPGFHRRLGWNSKAVPEFYVGTYEQ